MIPLLAASLAIASMVSTDAGATLCPPPITLVWTPRLDATNVPTNAVIRYGLSYAVFYDLEVELEVNGETITDFVREDFIQLESWVTVITPSSHFPADASVEVRDAKSGSIITRFRVGSGPDLEPPTWDGDYARTVVKSKDWARLGPYRGFLMTFEGLSDNHWAEDELLILAEPIGEGEPLASAAPYLHAGSGFCFVDDPTLERTLRREYAIMIMDGSGNIAGPFDVRTKAACGCTTNSATGLSGLLFLLPMLWRRRSAAPPNARH